MLSYANDSNCWLADPAVDALAPAVVGALARPDPARLARAAETAARFDWGRVTPQIFATYDGLRERALTVDRARWQHELTCGGAEVTTGPVDAHRSFR